MIFLAAGKDACSLNEGDQSVAFGAADALYVDDAIEFGCGGDQCPGF